MGTVMGRMGCPPVKNFRLMGKVVTVTESDGVDGTLVSALMLSLTIVSILGRALIAIAPFTPNVNAELMLGVNKA